MNKKCIKCNKKLDRDSVLYCTYHLNEEIKKIEKEWKERQEKFKKQKSVINFQYTLFQNNRLNINMLQSLNKINIDKIATEYLHFLNHLSYINMLKFVQLVFMLNTKSNIINIYDGIMFLYEISKTNIDPTICEIATQYSSDPHVLFQWMYPIWDRDYIPIPYDEYPEELKKIKFSGSSTKFCTSVLLDAFNTLEFPINRYDISGKSLSKITSEISLDNIKDKFKILSLKYHPDKSNDNKNNAAKYINILNSYNLLKTMYIDDKIVNDKKQYMSKKVHITSCLFNNSYYSIDKLSNKNLVKNILMITSAIVSNKFLSNVLLNYSLDSIPDTTLYDLKNSITLLQILKCIKQYLHFTENKQSIKFDELD